MCKRRWCAHRYCAHAARTASPAWAWRHPHAPRACSQLLAFDGLADAVPTRIAGIICATSDTEDGGYDVGAGPDRSSKYNRCHPCAYVPKERPEDCPKGALGLLGQGKGSFLANLLDDGKDDHDRLDEDVKNLDAHNVDPGSEIARAGMDRDDDDDQGSPTVQAKV